MNGFNENELKKEPWEAYHSNGKLAFKGTYVNGKIHGLCECYHSNGKLWYKGNYVNDIQKGYFHNFWDNDKLNLKCYYL
jgi:antitoxin component YwqK of YwqJK toxin-antitoxin module